MIIGGTDCRNDPFADTGNDIAQAKAEERRAMAVAQEQEMRARVEEMRAKVVEAEAEVPLAMSEAPFAWAMFLSASAWSVCRIAPMFLPMSTSAISIDRISNAVPESNPLLKTVCEIISGFSSTFL